MGQPSAFTSGEVSEREATGWMEVRMTEAGAVVEGDAAIGRVTKERLGEGTAVRVVEVEVEEDEEGEVEEEVDVALSGVWFAAALPLLSLVDSIL